MDYTNPFLASTHKFGQDEPAGINSNSLYNTYDRVAITPCFTANIGGYDQTSQFHLLSCGHIILVDNHDRRCSQSCHHALEQSIAHPSSSSQEPHSKRNPTFPGIARTQNHEALYCEVCRGIPYDSYRTLFPLQKAEHGFQNNMPFFRRCVSLTRALIANTMMLPLHAVQSLLCPVFEIPGNTPHELSCGHRVWCPTGRSCGVNCKARCSLRYGEEKRDDVLFCDECIRRAELVYERYGMSRRR